MADTPQPDWQELLEQWIGAPGITAIVLAAVSDGTGVTILDTYEPSTKKKEKKPKPGELAARFIAGARSHCEALAIVHRYSVAVMKGAGVVAQQFMRLEPLSPPVNIGSSEMGAGSVPVALFKPGLRYIEKMHQLADISSRALLMNLAATVERQNVELDRTRKTDVERLEFIQELLDRKATRDLEQRQADKQEERLDHGLEQLGHVVKLIAARLSGADSASVVMRQLPMDKLGPLLDQLDDEGRAAFRSMLAQASEGEQARQGLLALSPAGPPPKEPPKDDGGNSEPNKDGAN